MQRIVEPELMDCREQAEAYALADFEESHRGILDAFSAHFPGIELEGNILDLGCGPGDITFRFAARFPNSSVLGVDGSPVMIELANQRKVQEGVLGQRVTFLEGLIPDAPIPLQRYAAIVSNSLLHHLHAPGILWQTVSRHASAGTKVFIADLFRPPTPEEAARIVQESASGEPEILQRDFYNSLVAAFEPGEIETQLAEAGFHELQVDRISDRHVVIFGEKA